jgi:hypothetical protein
MNAVSRFKKAMQTKNSRVFRRGFGTFIGILAITVVWMLFSPKNAFIPQHVLVVQPFLFLWYYYSTLDLRFFHVRLLTRNFDRDTLFRAGLLSGTAFFVAVAVAAFVIEAGTLPKIGVGAWGVRFLIVLILLALDYLLLVSIAYAFRFLGIPVLSFVLPLLPFILIFKPQNVFEFFQIHYVFPLLPLTEMEPNAIFATTGSWFHLFGNIATAFAILTMGRYVYLNCDIPEQE